MEQLLRLIVLALLLLLALAPRKRKLRGIAITHTFEQEATKREDMTQPTGIICEISSPNVDLSLPRRNRFPDRIIAVAKLYTFVAKLHLYGCLSWDVGKP